MSNQQLAPCRVCGEPVSEFAQACPKCGDPTAARYGHSTKRHRMSLGKWVLLVLGVFVVYSCVRSTGDGSVNPSSSNNPAPAPSPIAPSYLVHVVSLECESNYGRNRASITVRNTGSSAIPYAKAFFEFKSKEGSVVSASDSYFSPTTIPPGATAKANAYAAEGTPEAATCGASTIQDGDGNPVAIN